MLSLNEIFTRAGITSLESPDASLVITLQRNGYFPVVRLLRQKKRAVKAPEEIAPAGIYGWGVCPVLQGLLSIPLPENVNTMIVPSGCTVSGKPFPRLFCQLLL